MRSRYRKARMISVNFSRGTCPVRSAAATATVHPSGTAASSQLPRKDTIPAETVVAIAAAARPNASPAISPVARLAILSAR